MESLEKDIQFFASGVAELSDYLLSRELYWPLSGSHGYRLPRLTIGGLLLTGKRLEVLIHEKSDRRLFDESCKKLDIARSKWRVHWEQKAERELSTRLNLWSNYLNDYRSSPYQYADLYRYEVRWRVILDLLVKELPTTLKTLPGLAELDNLIKTFWVPGEFIWEIELVNCFPRSDYWYLYGTLKN